MAGKKITPFLWFDGQAEQAAKFYTSVFKNSSIKTVTKYTPEVSDAARRPSGSVMTVDFELDGQPFVALNGGPAFKFTEAVSFVINCETQDEVDYFWAKLTEGGGQESMCGWLKDKFGLSWQVVPTMLTQLLSDKDPERTRRAMTKMLEMKKLDIEALKRAADGR